MERSIIKYISIIALVLFLPLGALAQSETGGVESIFSYGAGLRPLAMGGAFTAMTGDPTLAYWNPGAMSFNQYKEISLFGTRLIADTYYAAGFYTHPSISFGTLSIGGIGAYTGGIESYDENASPITDASTNYLHYQILLSYGYNFKWGLGIGSTAKIEQLRITDFKGTGASFDLGVFYSPPKNPWFAVGAVVQDVYGTGIKLVDEFEKPTRIYKAGIATNFFAGANKNTRVTFAVDGRVFTDNYNPDPGGFIYDLSFGTEISFAERFMIRAGYRNFSPEGGFNFPQGASAGAGVRLWNVGIDYAVSFEDSDWQGPLELLMRLGLSYRFGKSVDERRVIEAEKMRTKIDEGIRDATSQYEIQLEELAAEYEKEREQLERELDQRYQEQLASIGDTIEETRQKVINELSIQYESDKLQALNELTAAYEMQRAALELQLLQQRESYEDRLDDLQRRFEQERNALSESETFKSEQYAQGLQLFSDGNYKEALDAFESVATVDPNYLRVQEYIQRSRAQMTEVTTYDQQILDLYYSGMELFLEKRYEEAISEWQKILEIDPYNKLALRNIKEAQDRLRKIEELGIGE